MPYSRKEDVLFYGRFSESTFGGYGFGDDSNIAKAIQAADNRIDEYCGVLEGFFSPGGVAIDSEYHDGMEIRLLAGNQIYYWWAGGGLNFLRLNYNPVLSVVTFAEETGQGTWTTRTEGSASDYIVSEDGIYFIQNMPKWKRKNIRVTYKVGYKATPRVIQEISGELAAEIVHAILDKENRQRSSQSGTTSEPPKVPEFLLSAEMKERLSRYMLYDYVGAVM